MTLELVDSQTRDPTVAKRKLAGTRALQVAKWGLAIAGAAALFAISYHLNLPGRLELLFKQALAWIAGLGILGPIIFAAIYILACVLFVPASILTLGAGVIFGVVQGSAYVSLASILGASSAFLIGRYLARGWVARKIEGNEKFKAIDEAVAREGWKIVGLTRLSPALPFVLLNYAFAITRVSFKEFFFASWIGMFPGTVLWVYIGSLAGDVARIGMDMEERTRSPLEWLLYAVGLAATVAATVAITRIARKALERKVA